MVSASQVALVDRSFQYKEAMQKLLKFHLSWAQDRMKQFADKKRFEKEFKVGDLVYLKL